VTEAAETGRGDPSLEDLRAVHAASLGLVRETPTMTLRSLSRELGGEVVLKAENLQRTGSFKLRGSLATLRSIDRASCTGVVTGSAGNHAQSLAYAARNLGIPCRVYMPTAAAVGKVDSVEAFGGEVVRGGGAVDECIALARAAAAAEGLLFVHPFDDPEVIAGQAGVGIELTAQVVSLRRVIVPVGGGGLASGMAMAIKLAQPEVEVIGVQAAGCAPFAESLREGRPVELGSARTIADGIAVKRPGEITLPLIERWLDGMVAVDDDAIVEAMVLLAERAKLVTEGAGAVSTAALLSGAVEPAKEGATALVLSGGNVDPRLLAAAINRHEIREHRRVRISTRVDDHPGGLADLLRTIAEGGANVIEVFHVRERADVDLGETSVSLLLETRGRGHIDRLRAELSEAGYELSSPDD
jgi:threonine dehydratase